MISILFLLILTSISGLEKAQGLTNHEIVIQVNLNKLANYIIVQAQTMVTNATSYDVLIWRGGGGGGGRWKWCTIHGFTCYVLYVCQYQ